MRFPDIITFSITSRCDHDCSYCYRKKGTKELGFDELKKIFKLFAEKGVKAIVLTGGEPLLREDIAEILEEINKHRIKIFLDTHGDNFFKYKKEIDKYVDILGLPIDSAKPEGSYRSKENFSNILKILDYYDGKEEKPQIRVGTVVTSENKDGLEDIGELLKKHKIDSWKMYQFIPRGTNGTINKENLKINTEKFIDAASKAKEKYSKHFKIIISRIIDRNKAYFFLKPDGTVFMPINDMTGSDTIVLGTIFDKDIMEKWEKCVSEKNYLQNAAVTFGHKF